MRPLRSSGPTYAVPTQVEFVAGFGTPIPAGSGGKLELAWLTSAGKRIAHPVVAQAESQPVLDFLELSDVPDITSFQEPRSSCGRFRALGMALGEGRMWVNVWCGPQLWPGGTERREALSEESPLATARL